MHRSMIRPDWQGDRRGISGTGGKRRSGIKCAGRTALLALAIACQGAFANPEGPQVVHGSASFSRPNASTLNVTNSHNAIINWQKFNIDRGQTTNFIQPGSNSAVLNRVMSNNPSRIYGNLNSNGKVFLINQHGLMIGAGAQINTAGFFGSTLNITNEDFLNGNLRFEGGGFGGIQNYGYIHAGPNGNVVLVAPDIENGGVIEVDNGNVILAAGESIRITSLNDAAIEFELQAPENGIVNLGEIIANQGAARLFAGNLKHSGSINANAVVRNPDGSISLVAQQDIEVTAGATLDADGDAGGAIRVHSQHGDVRFSGAASARGRVHHGGRIEILGERVGLFGDALADASGATGGGTVLVGGDFQGRGEVQTARHTQVGPHARLRADALDAGDGGRVIAWADETTIFAGSATARGGAQAGDGGLIEVSGKQALRFTGKVDASAAGGEAGAVLFDPHNLTIASPGDPATAELSDLIFDFTEPTSSTDSIIEPLAITSIANGGTAVILRANNDLSVNAAIATNGSGLGGDLTLQAGRSILINANISTDNGKLLLTANEFAAANLVVDAQRDPGAAEIRMADGVTVNTGTGNLEIRLQAGDDKTNFAAGDITLATILTNDLLITHNGQSAGNSILRTATGSITANSIFIDHDDLFGNLLGPGGNRSIGTPALPLNLVSDFIAAHIHGASTGGIYIDAQPRLALNVTAGDTCYGEGGLGCLAHGIRGFDTDAGELVLKVTGGGLEVTEPIDIAGLLSITADGDISANTNVNAKPIRIRGDAVTLTSAGGSVNLSAGDGIGLDASIESTLGFSGDVTINAPSGSLNLVSTTGSDAFIVADNGTNALNLNLLSPCSGCVAVGYDPRGDSLGTAGVAASNFLAAVNWTGAFNFDWNNPANWDVGGVPIGNADVAINVGPAGIISLASGLTHDVNSLATGTTYDLAISGTSTQLNVLNGLNLNGVSFTLGTGAQLNLEGPSNVIVGGTGFNNAGTIALLPSVSNVELTLSGGIATNAGKILLDNTGGGAARLVAGSTIINAGTIQSVGGGLPNQTDGFFENQGLLDLDHDLSAQGGLANFILRGGTLDLAPGVNFNLAVQNFAWDGGTIFGAPSSTITGTPIRIGQFASGGTLTLDGGLALPVTDAVLTDDLTNGPTSLNVKAGLLDVFGFLAVESGALLNLDGGAINLNTGGGANDNQIYVFDATFNWLAGSITGSGVTGAGVNPRGLIFIDSSAGTTSFNIDGIGAHTLDDVDIDNFERLNFTNNAVLDLVNSVSIVNRGFSGLIEFAGNSGINVASGVGPFVLLNEGTIVKTAGGNTIIDASLSMGIDSRLEIASGSLGLNGAPLTLPVLTELAGAGSFVGDVISLGGLIDPQTSLGDPATLTITGSLSLDPGSTVAFDLAGTSQGLTYDFIDVGGNVSLSGLLALFWDNQFTAANGNSFDLIRTGGSFSGGFDRIIDPAGVTASSVNFATPTVLQYVTDVVSPNIIFWNVNASGSWSTTTNWLGGVVPTSGDYAVINQDDDTIVVSIDSPVTIAGMEAQNNVTIGSTGSLTIDDELLFTGDNFVLGSIGITGLTINGVATIGAKLDWSSGAIGGTGVIDIHPFGVLNINPGAGNLDTDIVNRSAFGSNWLGGAAGGTGSITSNGLLLLDGAFSTSIPLSIGVKGEVIKTLAGGTTTFVQALTNDGLLQVDSGLLQLQTAAAHSGIFDVATGATLSFGGGASSSSGVIEGTGTIDIVTASSLTNSGVINPGGPGIIGILSVGGGGNLLNTGFIEIDIQNGATPVAGVDYDQLQVAGNIDLQGFMKLQPVAGYTVTENDSFVPIVFGSSSGNALNFPPIGGEVVTPAYNANDLTIQLNLFAGIYWDGGAGDGLWSSASNWSGDVVPTTADDVLIGTSFDVTVAAAASANALNLNGGASLTIGAATLSLAGGSSLAGLLTLADGASTVDVATALNLSSSLDFNGGTLTGAGTTTLASTATLNLAGTASVMTLDAHTLVLDAGATAIYAATVNGFAMNNGALLINNGTFNLSQLGITAAGAASTIQNGGQFTVGSSAATVAARFVNGGTLDLPGGSSLNLTGGLAFTGSPAVLNNAGALQIGSVFNFDGGTLSGAGTTTLLTGAALNLRGAASQMVLDAHTLVLDAGATAIYDATASGLAINNGALLINNGDFNLQSTLGIAAAGAASALQNGGRFTVGPLAATVAVPFDNGGTPELPGGTLELQAGASLTLPGGLTLGNGALLSGGGTLAGNVVNNGGLVEPGGPNAIGTLTISGDYSQAGGQLRIEIQSTGVAGSDYDQLVIGGDANLLGNLSLLAIGGYTVAVNDSLTPVVYSTRISGNLFDSISPIGQEIVTPTYGAAGLDLVLGFGSSMSWDGGAGTSNWNDALNWSLDFVPDASFDVSIAGATVDVSSVESVNSLNLNGNLNLNINGGLTIAGALTVGGGTLTVDGGSLTANGTATFDGDYVQTAGSATFTGNAVFNAGYRHAAGATIFNGGADFNAANAHAGGSTVFNGTASLRGATSISGGTLAFNTVGTLHNLNNSWSGGTITGAAGPNLVLGVSPGDTRLAISGGGAKTLSAITLDVNQNDIVMSGSGGLNFVNATVANTNGSSFDHSGDGAFLGSGTFDNSNGSFSKLSGSLLIPASVNFVNTAGSQVNVGGGGRLVFEAAATDAGNYNVARDGALLFPNGRTLDAGSTLNLQGTLFAGNALTLPGTVSNSGNLVLDNATLDLTNLGGTLRLENGASLAGTGTVAGNLLNSSGVLAVGGAGRIGNLTIGGNYGQGAAAAMVIDVFNNGFTTLSDRLFVSAAASLDGVLVIGFTTDSLGLVTAGFKPFSFGTASGSFGRVIDAAGNILRLEFSGGEFTILGSSPEAPDSVIEDLVKFAEEGEELADEVADNRSEADAAVDAMLEEEQGSGELVCR